MRESGNTSPASEAMASAASNSPLRILLGEDRELVLETLRPVIARLAPDVRLVECGSLASVLEAASAYDDWRLAILDLRLADMGGVEGLRTFRQRFPDIPLVALCCHCSPHEIIRAFQSGVFGFIPETLGSRSVEAALWLILSGQKYVPAHVLSIVERYQPYLTFDALDDKTRPNRPTLTNREGEVLSALLEGLSNKGIARCLGIQEVTVKLHMRKIFRKLGVGNRAQAVRVAMQDGWCVDR